MTVFKMKTQGSLSLSLSLGSWNLLREETASTSTDSEGSEKRSHRSWLWYRSAHRHPHLYAFSCFNTWLLLLLSSLPLPCRRHYSEHNKWAGHSSSSKSALAHVDRRRNKSNLGILQKSIIFLFWVGSSHELASEQWWCRPYSVHVNFLMWTQ